MGLITHQIIAKYGDLSISEKTTRAACLVSWNDAPLVLDIRSWSNDGVRAFKGITLTRSESEALRDILNQIDFDVDFGEESENEINTH